MGFGTGIYNSVKKGLVATGSKKGMTISGGVVGILSQMQDPKKPKRDTYGLFESVGIGAAAGFLGRSVAAQAINALKKNKIGEL